jgi:hypothetical protein
MTGQREDKTMKNKNGWNKTTECLPKFTKAGIGPLVLVGWKYGSERIARPLMNKEGQVEWTIDGHSITDPEFWMNIPAVPRG